MTTWSEETISATSWSEDNGGSLARFAYGNILRFGNNYRYGGGYDVEDITESTSWSEE